MVNKETIKKEALKRMSILKLHPDVKKAFRKTGRLYYSEKTLLCGLYWLDDRPLWAKLVELVTEEEEFFPYFVIFSQTPEGAVLNILYVSKWERDWEAEREMLSNHESYCYVYNLNDSMYSEYATIKFAKFCGGLVRTR